MNWGRPGMQIYCKLVSSSKQWHTHARAPNTKIDKANWFLRGRLRRMLIYSINEQWNCHKFSIILLLFRGQFCLSPPPHREQKKYKNVEHFSQWRSMKRQHRRRQVCRTDTPRNSSGCCLPKSICECVVDWGASAANEESKSSHTFSRPESLPPFLSLH